MFKLFIRRPILSAVISVIIVCLGALALVSLPITQFPDIVPPSVTVCHQRCTGHDLYDYRMYQRRNVAYYGLL